MYMVFWVSYNEGTITPMSQGFKDHELTQTLKFMEDLRRQQRTDGSVGFVGMVSEDPNSVGLPGVSDKLPEGYDWSKKFRGDGPVKDDGLGVGRTLG